LKYLSDPSAAWVQWVRISSVASRPQGQRLIEPKTKTVQKLVSLTGITKESALMDALQKDWTFTRQLTVDLLDACSQGDLDFALNSHCGPLWKQFRHMDRVHENYLSALKTGQVNFDPADGSYAGKASAKYLNDYFEKLEKYHITSFAGLGSGQVVSWFGEDVSPCIHLCRLLAHETLHHGHLILYWRALGHRFPESWANWGEG